MTTTNDSTRARLLVGLIAAEGMGLAWLVADSTRAGLLGALAVLAATAGLARVARPPTRPRHSAALLTFALTGVIVGGTSGVHHLVVDQSSLSGIAGVTAALVGLVLTVIATTRLVRAMPGWWRLTAVPIGIVTLIGLVMPAALAVFVSNPPDFPLGEATPADHGLTYEDVTVTTDDGVDLEAWYVPSHNGAAVVLLGGCCSARDSVLDLATLFAAHDYGVLMLDMRGHGGSEGRAMLWGWWGEHDIRAGVDYLTERADVRDGRIGAIGMSVGGEQAFAAAGVDPRIRAVVGEGTSARGARDEGNPADGADGLFIRYVDRFTKSAAAVMSSASRPLQMRDAFAAMSDQKAFVIASGAMSEEVRAAEVFESAAPDTVSTWIVPNATHTGARLIAPEEWERRVFAFFDETLDVRATSSNS
jgi:pimeloyl-ACP methyl ester carboxylesterase